MKLMYYYPVCKKKNSSSNLNNYIFVQCYFRCTFVQNASSDALQLGRSVQTLKDDWKQIDRPLAFLVAFNLNHAEFLCMK